MGNTLNPQHVMTDFEIAVINTVKIEFPEATHKCCLFHLGQNVWRKIQSCGLASRYARDSEFSLRTRHMIASAYLPPEEITDAFAQLKSEVLPEEAESYSVL